MPNVHRQRDVPEAESPRAELECEVLHRSAAGRRRHRTRKVLSHGSADVRALEDGGIAGGERAAHPCQRLVGPPLRLTQPRLEDEAQEPGRNGGETLGDLIRVQHPLL